MSAEDRAGAHAVPPRVVGRYDPNNDVTFVVPMIPSEITTDFARFRCFHDLQVANESWSQSFAAEFTCGYERDASGPDRPTAPLWYSFTEWHLFRPEVVMDPPQWRKDEKNNRYRLSDESNCERDWKHAVASCSSELLALYHRHAIAAMEKQRRANALVHPGSSDPDWELDLTDGTLVLRDWDAAHDEVVTERWPVQVLGTEDERAGEWRWAHPPGGFPNASLLDVASIQKFGRDNNIPELVRPTAPREVAHRLCLVASAVSHFGAYFRVSYPGGAVFVAINDTRLLDAEPHPGGWTPVRRALGVLPPAVVCLGFPDPGRAIREYLSGLGQKVHEGPDWMGLTEDGVPALRIEFDGHGRVVRLSALTGSKDVSALPDRSTLPSFD